MRNRNKYFKMAFYKTYLAEFAASRVEKAQKVGLLRPIFPKITLTKRKGKIERARRKKKEKRKKQWLHSYFYSVFWLLYFERNKLLMKQVYSRIMFLKTQLDLL